MLAIKYSAIILFLVLLMVLVFAYLLQSKKLTPYWKKVLIVSVIICLIVFALMFALILAATLGFIQAATTL